MSVTTSTSKWLLTVTASMSHNLHVFDSLRQILKRAESTINHYRNRTTDERCVMQLLISSELAPQKFCKYCRKFATISENRQKMCRKSVAIAENVHKIFRKSPGITENVQKICSYCRKFEGIAENLQLLQKICKCCRKSAGITENVQKICRYCRKSAAIA